MGQFDVRQAVKGFLAVNWTGTPIAYENDGYEAGVDANGTTVPWIYVELTGGIYEQRSIGAGSAAANLWISEGQLWLHVFVGSGTGPDLATQYADALAELFRGLELDPNIEFGDININGGGGRVDGNNWALSVSIDWTQG